MDILKKYNKENPEVRPQAPQWKPSEEYGWPTRFVMRFSMGRIQNERQANMVLVIAAVALALISFLILINAGSSARPHPPGKIINLPGQPPRLAPTPTPRQ